MGVLDIESGLKFVDSVPFPAGEREITVTLQTTAALQ
jgi:hypothetical protein